MSSEALIQYLLQTDKELNLNPNTAQELGLDFNALTEDFSTTTGKVFNPNETIKVRFDREGQYLDFSTLDNFSIRVPYLAQNVGPNKTGIDREK